MASALFALEFVVRTSTSDWPSWTGPISSRNWTDFGAGRGGCAWWTW